MDSRTALEISCRMRDETKHAAYFDDLTANGFWGAIMLLCNGWSADEVRAVGRCYTRFMGRSVTLSAVAADPLVRQLQDVLERRPMADPPQNGLIYEAAGSS